MRHKPNMMENRICFQTISNSHINSKTLDPCKMPHQKAYLVTGANRGIGFELVSQLSADSSNIVYGTARDLASAAGLKKLASSHPNFKPLEADVVKPETLKSVADVVAKEHGYVDVLIANAGIAETYSPVKDVSLDELSRHWDVNTKGAVITYQAIRPLVVKSQEKKIVFISSLAGSVAGFFPMPNPAYGSSKAALNYIIRSISAESEGEGLKVLSMHPGMVATDMGKRGLTKIDVSSMNIAVISPEESARAILEQIEKLDETDKFLSYDGTTASW
ncbi:unnamed protein product [Kuraishia capsulata CBS 1993]|uniref:NAD(P)-binding protein n=1 Tax=Kuraishia capsulata CBS 1993 TaxID=1382522 RepID=W6MGZ9_9ASCO|nr:uncharacterized protein KUCA_T00001449001 [Kuraishia capsulata CBS 1993]CDK25479.1 unnamed protein product [Kuraishia capsulata CBS 1993]